MLEGFGGNYNDGGVMGVVVDRRWWCGKGFRLE